MELTPGQVWWALPDSSVGREQSGRRPVMVISNDDYHASATTLVLVVPLTTTNRRWPNHVPVAGRVPTEPGSFAMTEQVRAISRERLRSPIGVTTIECLDEVRSWVVSYLVE